MSEANRDALRREFVERMGSHLKAEGLVSDWELQYCVAIK